MKAAIDAGKIGKPALGVFQYSWRDAAYYASDPWRGKWDTEGGGVLVNQSPHQLDILLWLMGPAAEVSGYWANLNHPTVEVDDTAVASIRFGNGGLGSIVTSLSQKPGIYTKVHIHGSNGASVGVETDRGATFIAGVSHDEAPGPRFPLRILRVPNQSPHAVDARISCCASRARRTPRCLWPDFELSDNGLSLYADAFPGRLLEVGSGVSRSHACARTGILFGCLGLHEWAMVYRDPNVRHPYVPLLPVARGDRRRGRFGVQTLRCTHLRRVPVLHSGRGRCR